jgi:hypothetical protein
MLGARCLLCAVLAFLVEPAAAQETTFRVIEQRPIIQQHFLERDDLAPTTREQFGTERRSGEVSATQVNAQIRSILASFSKLFEEVEEGLGVALDEITLTLEVSAEGSVGLFGTGVTAGSTGGVVVTLRRPALFANE